MSKRGLIFSILIIISLSIISSATAPEKVKIIKDELQEASYIAEKYHSGNDDWTRYTVRMSQIQEKINTELVSSSPEEIKEAIGEPSQEVRWATQSQGSDVKLETPVPEWNNMLFDGKERVKYEIIPEQVDGEKIQYQIDFTTEFAQSRPNLEIIGAIENLKVAAKTVVLYPTVTNVNDIAETIASTEKLFNDYAQQAPESCEELMATILGEESKLSTMEVVTKEFEVASNGNMKVFASIKTCENCKGQDVENFVNLEMWMEKDGIKVQYTDNKYTKDMFAKLNINGHKSGLIEAYQALTELVTAGNYRSAEDMMYRMIAIDQSWNDIGNMGGEEARIKNFVEMNSFMNSLFQGLLLKTSISEQTRYQKIIYQELKNDTIAEICNNHIDDNSNERIDCQEVSCSGQICGSKEITSEENNETITRSIELYCIEGLCQAKEEKQNQTIEKCGNNICEQNEIETCPSDCKKCPEYPPIDCQGEVIFKGKDKDGCSIDPICMPKTNSCDTTQDCDQPLCGNAECISGECRTTSLSDCREKTCTEGEQKLQKCVSGEQIAIEICTNSAWKPTGFKCSGAISTEEPIIQTKNTGKTIIQDSTNVGEPIVQTTNQNACRLLTACGNPRDVCSNGMCITPPLKKENTLASESTPRGISFTGQMIGITNTAVMTGISREGTNNIDVLNPPKDYQRAAIPEGQSPKASITGISRQEAELPVTVNVKGTDNSQQKPITIASSGNEETLFAVTGLCINNKEGEKSVLSFDGQGEKFQAVSNLKAVYEKKGTEPYCKWKLGNLLSEREEIRKSFNDEFARRFFEEQIPNSANGWESATNPIQKIYQQIVQNQKETAEMMECLGIKELDSYNLIKISYKGQYGSLVYEENVGNVKLQGMTNEVKLITPSIKELTIFPPQKFIENSLTKSMKDNTLPGSIQTQAERNFNNGLTNKEIAKIKGDKELMQKFAALSSQEIDQDLNVQLEVVNEKGETVYNLYLKINGEDGIIAESMLPELTPTKDVKVVVKLNNIYKVLSQSEERFNTQNAPWQGESFTPITLVNKAVDYFKTRGEMNNLFGNLEVTPPELETEIKAIFENVFYKMAGEDVTTTQTANTEETQFYSPNGDRTVLTN